eukprot:TRINITY_DN126_c0_g1_i1.p3 TRINITY_DN126_c0_g1~~TRINITY_DN126_c0_g1_i1.p3  ORF type:complete len:127 (+),score=40.93 TRINITY_DN126_c0_g1_i1:437-817(+)
MACVEKSCTTSAAFSWPHHSDIEELGGKLRELNLSKTTQEEFMGIPFDVPDPDLSGFTTEERIKYWNARMLYWRKIKIDAERRLAELRSERTISKLTVGIASLSVSSAICKPPRSTYKNITRKQRR